MIVTPRSLASAAIACVMAPMPPIAWPHLPRLAVDLAETVVQQHVGGTRRVRAGIVADDRVPAEHGLQRFGLEPAVEPVASALREDVDEIALALARQAPEPEQQLRRRDKIAPAFDDPWPAEVRRRLQHPLLQLFSEPIQPRVVRRQSFGVPRGEARHFGLRGRRIAAEAQRASVRQRHEIRERSLDDPEPALDEPQVADHLGVQQADRVARGRVAEARMELLGDGGAADDTAPLDDAHLEAGSGEVAGAGQAVVAARR